MVKHDNHGYCGKTIKKPWLVWQNHEKNHGFWLNHGLIVNFMVKP